MTNKPNRAKLAELFQRVAPTQAGFAEALTRQSGNFCSQQAVQNWLKREQVPVQWVGHIVRAGGGKVSAAEIRPDVFGVTV